MTISKQEIDMLFETMRERFNPEKAVGLDAIIQFNLTGESSANYWARVNNGEIELHEGESENARMTLIADAQDYANIVAGNPNAMQAFMQGKLKIKGDMSLAMKLQSIFGL